MTTLTTQHRFEVSGGTLQVVLSTDHALSTAERAALDEIATACGAFGARAGRGRAAPLDAAAEIDEAIWELGGDEGIVAG